MKRRSDKEDQAMEDNLIARVDALQSTGFELLDHLHLRELWQAHGTTVLVGSLRTRLTVEPNIDFNVITDEPDLDACFDVLRAVARNTVEFDDVYLFLGNRLNKPHPYLSAGIGFRFKGEKWVIDHLIFGSDHPHARYADQTTQAILNVLDEEKRQRILRIKHERLKSHGIHMGGGKGLDSLDIYRAFFDGGAMTYGECEAWAASHPREEYASWSPSLKR
jgi:hypothetical protein